MIPERYLDYFRVGRGFVESNAHVLYRCVSRTARNHNTWCWKEINCTHLPSELWAPAYRNESLDDRDWELNVFRQKISHSCPPRFQHNQVWSTWYVGRGSVADFRQVCEWLRWSLWTHSDSSSLRCTESTRSSFRKAYYKHFSTRDRSSKSNRSDVKTFRPQESINCSTDSQRPGHLRHPQRTHRFSCSCLSSRKRPLGRTIHSSQSHRWDVHTAVATFFRPEKIPHHCDGALPCRWES